MIGYLLYTYIKIIEIDRISFFNIISWNLILSIVFYLDLYVFNLIFFVIFLR